MGEDTKIGWTHRPRTDGTLMPGHTFNIAWGCQKVSEECDDCYAEVWAKRLGLKVWGPPKTTPRKVMSDAYWRKPLTWDADARAAGERHLVFCSSMADVLEDHPTIAEQRPRLWQLIAVTPNLVWLLLTKRPQNAPRMFPEPWMEFGLPINVWVGATAGLQERLDERWPHLRAIPAVVRFLSVEPMLGPVLLPPDAQRVLHWVIVGGHTAPDAKRTELDIENVHALARHASYSGIPVYVKQDSGRYPGLQGRLPPELWALKKFPRVGS